MATHPVVDGGRAAGRWRELLDGPAPLLALLMALFALVASWNYGEHFPGEDFYLFWSVGQMAGAPEIDDLYSEEGRARVGEVFAARGKASSSEHLRTLTQRHPLPMVAATPFYYALFGTLAGDDYDADLSRHRLASLAATLLLLLVVCGALGYGVAATALAFVAFTVFFEPFRSCVRTANVSQLQLGVLALFLWLQLRPGRPWRQVAGGALLGLLVIFKPNVVVVVLLLAVARLARGRRTRLRREALGFAGGTLLATLFGAIVFRSPSCWFDWLPVARSMMTSPPSVERGNFAFANLVGAALGFEASLLLLLVLLASCIVLLLRAARRAGPEPSASALVREDIALIGLASSVALLAAPLAWLHYYNLAVPLALYCLRPGASPAGPGWPRLRRLLAALASLAIALYPLMLVTPLRAYRTLAWLTTGGVGLLLILALVDLGRQRAAHGPAS